MAAYRRVYDSRHLQADCTEPGSAPEPYARQSSMGYLYFITHSQWSSSSVYSTMQSHGSFSDSSWCSYRGVPTLRCSCTTSASIRAPRARSRARKSGEFSTRRWDRSSVGRTETRLCPSGNGSRTAGTGEPRRTNRRRRFLPDSRRHNTNHRPSHWRNTKHVHRRESVHSRQTELNWLAMSRPN